MKSLTSLIEKAECAVGERCAVPVVKNRIFGYYKTIDTEKYAIFERSLGSDKVIAAYELCNLHGLWEKEL